MNQKLVFITGAFKTTNRSYKKINTNLSSHMCNNVHHVVRQGGERKDRWR
jgi:hypothetical protein